jgi:hypothetical protein
MRWRLAVGGLTLVAVGCYAGPHVDPDAVVIPGTSVDVEATEPGEEPLPEAESSADGGASATAPVCTSKKTWKNGDRGSKLMRPGSACIDCHVKERKAPKFAFAGTVYPTLHEPDDCYGTPAGVAVVVTDAKGKTATASVNAAGNFFFEGTLTPPLAAKVVSGGRERAMKEPVATGDCNGCHTNAGAKDAPGRISPP